MNGCQGLVKDDLLNYKYIYLATAGELSMPVKTQRWGRFKGVLNVK